MSNKNFTENKILELPYLSPAILSKTQEDFINKIKICQGRVESIQIDVMDGKFVPNSTLDIRFWKKELFEHFDEVRFHLMVSDNINYVDQIGLFGKKFVYELHYESLMASSKKHSVSEHIEYIKERKCRFSLAINPDTSHKVIDQVYDLLDSVLVMCVYPGFSGQKFITDVIGKIKNLHNEYPDIRIAVDGGVSFQNIPVLYESGAGIFCVASSIFGSNEPKTAINQINTLL
ncbi:MAG: hypothetical protein N3E37_01135, partial [Candidatus Micrarchaeota archaeon]|nr:hypothetical protein [Candidatus Micrarchaeota archaeon]